MLTTCAEDFVTWADVYRPGGGADRRRPGGAVPVGGRARTVVPSAVRGVAGRPDRGLDRGCRTVARAPGPIAPDLADAAEDWDGDAMVFYPYLYWPTVRVIERATVPTILHPAAHDEPALHLPIFPAVFDAADALVFQTEAERHLVESCFPVASHRQLLLGLGVDDPDGRRTAVPPGARIGGAPVPDAAFLCCLGRVDEPQGHESARRYFARCKERRPGPLRLVLAGPVVRGTACPPRHRRGRPGVRGRQVGTALRRGGRRVAVAVGGVLAGGGRGLERPDAGAGQRRVRRHRRALPAVGWWTALRRIRRVRGGGGPARRGPGVRPGTRRDGAAPTWTPGSGGP